MLARVQGRRGAHAHAHVPRADDDGQRVRSANARAAKYGWKGDRNRLRSRTQLRRLTHIMHTDVLHLLLERPGDGLSRVNDSSLDKHMTMLYH